MAGRILRRLAGSGTATADLAGCHPRDARGRRSGRGHRLRDLGARGARGRRDRPRGGAGRGSPAMRTSAPRRHSSCPWIRRRRGLVIAVSHDGGTAATNAALEAARAAGRSTAVITVSGRSPAGMLADLVVETGELDQGWCHTVGYLSPILAGAAVGAQLSGRALDPDTVAVLIAAGSRDEAGAETDRGRAGRGRAPRRDRVGRGPARRARADAQGRGGVVAAVGIPRPRDLPAWPPPGDRLVDRARPGPRRPRSWPRADRARGSGAGSRACDRSARPPRSSRPQPMQRWTRT